MTDERLGESAIGAFEALVEEGAEGSILRFESLVDMEEAFDRPAIVGLLPSSELALGAHVVDGSFDSIGEALILSNGWQSWSPSWELARGERLGRVRLIENLNLHNERPLARPHGRDEVVSHFVTWFRRGERFLALASIKGDGAPVAFRIDRRSSRVLVEIWAPGKRYARGESVAEVAVFAAPGFFELRDKLAAFFPASRFDRLAFLGTGERLRPGGYESWYNHYAAIDETLILGDLARIGANDNLINSLYLARGRPTVFQVDDGWERSVGDWRVDEAKFPGGMGAVAEAIRAKGLVPGIWFAPFIVTKGCPLFAERPGWVLRDASGEPVVAGWMQGWGGDFHVLDLSLPEVLDYLEGLLTLAIETWGFRYIKLDFLYAGALPGAWARGGNSHDLYRAALSRLAERLKNSSGEELAYLGCGAPLELSYAALPLMRVGADTLPAWDAIQGRLLGHLGRPSAWLNMKDSIGRALLDRSVFVSDPDVVFTRTKRIGLGETEKELVALVAWLFASQVMFSENPGEFDAVEAAFTRRLVGLYDELGESECAALRIEGLREVYRVSSRDGALSGVINLGNREAAVAGDWDPSRALVLHAREGSGALRFAPRSISLFRAPPTYG